MKPKLYSVATCIIDKDDGIRLWAHTVEALSMSDARQEVFDIVKEHLALGCQCIICAEQVTDKYIIASKKLQVRQESLVG